MSTSVLFVCLGNICRSPTAEGVFRKMAAEQGIEVEVDSAGTAAWHVGKSPDPRSQRAAKAAGYSIEHLRARQVCAQDFERFDYILAMDNSNLENLKAIRGNESSAVLHRFLEFCDSPLTEVPDPYYGGEDGFKVVIDLAERASQGLLEHIRSTS